MLLQRFRKKVTTVGVAEACLETDLIDFKLEALTLEEKVSHYFEKWRNPVNRYVVAAFGNPIEAEEITQEAFLQLYRRLHSGQTIINVRAWVFRAAHSLALNRIRGQQFVEMLDDDAWDHLEQTLVDVSANPEQRVLQVEKFNRLRQAITRLTAPERQCLHLRTKGLRYREIAEILELGTTTVAETLHRAIDKLSKDNNA